MTHAYFRYSEKFFTKGTKNGNSGAIAKASYRAAEKLQDTTWQYKTINDRSNKEHIAYKCIHTPEGTPERLADRQTLWNEVMAVEKAKNSTYAREIELSFDNNMSLDECIQSLEKWIKENLTDRGYIADACIHWKDGNHHAHIMTPDRTYNAKKDQWDPKASKAYEVIYNDRSVICKTKAELDKLKQDLESQNVTYKEKQKKVRHDNMRDKAIFQHRRDSWAEYQNEILTSRGLPLVSSKNLESQGLQKGRKYLSRKSYEKYKKEKELKQTLGSEYTYPRENERIYIRHRKDDLEKLDKMIEELDVKIAEEKAADDLEEKLHSIAIKTLPDKIRWHKLDPDDVAEYGEYNLLISEAWMQRYNKYVEKAGMDEYKVTHPLDLCEHLAPGCEIKDIHTYYDKAEIIRPEPTIDRVQQTLYKCLPERVSLTKDEMKASAKDPSVTGEKVLNQWLKNYNKYAEKAGLDKMNDVSDLCMAIYDDGKVERCARRYALVYEKAKKRLRIEENTTPVKTVKPIQKTVPVTPKKPVPVQTQTHSKAGQVIAAGIEDIGGRSGGQAVSEQTIDDMTSGMSRMAAVIIRALADLLKQIIENSKKEIRKNPSKISAPIKDVVKKEEPKKEPVKVSKEEKVKEQPKKYVIKNPTASEILDIRLDCAIDVDDRLVLESLKSLLKSMTKSQIKIFDNKILESKKILTFAEMKDIAVEIITASGSGGKNKDKNKDQSVDLER